MAHRVRVEWMNKTNRADQDQRISHIGGRNHDGSRWRLTEERAIAGIESRIWSFYVEHPVGHHVDLIVATRLGKKHLKTTTDGEQPDNLLALPESPA